MTDAAEPRQTVGRILASYVAIHNDILAPSTWQAIRRVVPVPGIFEAIPYDAHAQDLLTLREDLKNVGAEAAALLAAVDPLQPVRRFLAELVPYCLALDDSMARLGAICRQMADKANGAQGPSYTQYQHELAEYDQSIATYTALGKRVNELGTPPRSIPRRCCEKWGRSPISYENFGFNEEVDSDPTFRCESYMRAGHYSSHSRLLPL